ncbi:MAG: S8 family serine peptidase [Actinomycetota bacterium]|nr:S8 family serine peptidase [Actinomycetota bacterium]
MSKRFCLSILGMLLVLPGAAASARPDNSQGYVVVFEEGVGNPQGVATHHARAFGAKVDLVYDSAVKGYAAELSAGQLSSVRSDPRVAVVSPDRKVTASDIASGETLPTGLNRIDAELGSAFRTGGTNTTPSTPVAILDTGSGPHPDLNVVGGIDCTGAGSYSDANGHGTHVAGTVAAGNSGSGVVGMAPGAPIYSVRVLNAQGAGYWSWIICGIDWVTDTTNHEFIPVANMSLSGSGSDGACSTSALHLAICNSTAAGTTYVAAAGNSGTNFSRSVPAAYNEVLTVTAVADFNGAPGGKAAPTCRSDVDDTAADFSNYTTVGSSDVSHTIAAPGVCIQSSWLNGGYTSISGTSMASPHVAGALALCVANGACAGAATPSQVISKLRNDAAAQPASYGFKDDPRSPRAKRYYGYLAHAGGY